MHRLPGSGLPLVEPPPAHAAAPSASLTDASCALIRDSEPDDRHSSGKGGGYTDPAHSPSVAWPGGMLFSHRFDLGYLLLPNDGRPYRMLSPRRGKHQSSIGGRTVTSAAAPIRQRVYQ